MLMNTINKSLAHQLDKFVLYTMNRRLPTSFEDSYQEAADFETVLTNTSINLTKTAVYQLAAPGEHPVWLNTLDGEIKCHVRVQLAVEPDAPLVLYHHGFNELPYTSSWRRIFRPLTHHPNPFPAHTVCVQAPFHSNWVDPFKKGFASLQSIYQMFAGSLRIMELTQSIFETHGSDFTVAAGYSWGGITSVLYEGVFKRTRAVVPMLSSPDLAQAMWDIASYFNRPVPIPKSVLGELLDFTPYYERCDSKQIFPLMGKDDLFFRLENHEGVFHERPMITISGGHITAFWKANEMRQHILNALEWAKNDKLQQEISH